MRKLYRWVVFAGLVAGFAATARAQFNAAIEGTVTDSSGGSVPVAKVTLTSKDTAKSVSVVTGREGFYRFSELPPGQYDVSVEAPGFKREVREGVAVRAEQLEGVNITLSPGAVTESITVSAESTPALNTETADVSRTLTRREIERLPQLNRDPYELLRLATGVFGDGARDGGGNAVGLPNTTGPGGSNQSIFQTENQVAISANGQRISDNNYMIDGVSVNSLGWGGAAVVTPNQESVKQITVLSSAFSAEYGRNSGAQVLVVSQNGTNQLHGSGFFKYNDPGLNAFNKYGGQHAAPFVRVENKFRQYGGSVGGPIVKDKLFYFFSYEGLHNNTNVPYTAWVETPQFRQAVIAARPGGTTARVFQAAGIAPRVISVLSAPCSGFAAGACQVVPGGLDIGSLTGKSGQYVDPNLNPTGAGLDGVPDIQFAQLGNPSSATDSQYNLRADYTHGNDAFAFSTYLTPQNSTTADPAGRSRPMADLNNKPFNSAYTLTYTRFLSPTMLNEARFNFTRFAWNQMATSSNVNWGIPRIEVEALPFDRIRFGAPQSEATPAIFAQNTYEFRDTLSKVWGAHAFKAGVEDRREQNNNNLAGGARPDYSFSGLFNLANDTPIFEGINADPNTGKPANAQRYIRTGLYSLFLQDDFKLRRNLTLGFGLRWEYDPPLTDTRGQLSNLYFGSNGLSNSSVRVTSQLYQPDRNNFAPRLSFAYSPGSKLVVRGGAGIFYNRIPEAVFDNTHGNPPFFARYGICCGTASTWFSTPFANNQILYALGGNNTVFSYPVNPALAIGIDPTTGAPQGPSHPNGPGVEIYMAQQNTPNPYVYVWSFDTEYQLPERLVATVGYQGSAGHKQIRLVNQNYLYPNNPAFYAVYDPQPDVNTNFNALLLTMSRRYANGLQFLTNYRWSKSIDTLSYEGPGFVTNQTYPQNLASERGPSDFDARHTWNATAVYDLPFFRKQESALGKLLGGYSISAILTYHTGFPWTPVTGQSVSTPGGPTLSPTRPVVYFGGAGNDMSNSAFITGSNFAGGGAKYFDITRGGPPGIGRNSFRGPNYLGNDFSLLKEIRLPINEASRLQLRVNLYNAFNKLNLQPIAFGSDSAHIESANLGVSPGGLSGRVVELQARVAF